MTAALQTLTLVPSTAPRRAHSAHDLPEASLDEFPSGVREVLGRLRLAALACRAVARVDVFHACATLSLKPEVAQAEVAEALMRVLPEALGRRPRFYRPGVKSVSFDEAWILRLIEAHLAGRPDDVAFLIGSRVVPPLRRQVGFLTVTLAQGADEAPAMSI